jgi:hypothetical protein
VREVSGPGHPRLTLAEIEERLADPRLGDGELAAIVRELEAQLATAAREPSASSRGSAKCRLADLLGAAARRSDAALALLAQLVGDRDGYEADSYSGWWEIAGERAREALYLIGERAVPVLVGELADPARRPAILDVLRAIGPRAKSAAPAIEAYVQDAQLAGAAGFALGAVLADDPDLAARCARMLDDPATRRAGLAATAALTPRAYLELIDRFIALLSDPDRTLRYLAANRVRALGRLAAPAEAALVALLDDPFDDVRREAAEALRALRG